MVHVSVFEYHSDLTLSCVGAWRTPRKGPKGALARAGRCERGGPNLDGWGAAGPITHHLPSADAKGAEDAEKETNKLARLALRALRLGDVLEGGAGDGLHHLPGPGPKGASFPQVQLVVHGIQFLRLHYARYLVPIFLPMSLKIMMSLLPRNPMVQKQVQKMIKLSRSSHGCNTFLSITHWIMIFQTIGIL